MHNIKTLTDIHLFADSLIYRFQVLPNNIKISVELFPYDWDDLYASMEKLPNIMKHDTNYHTCNGKISYRYEGILFNIKLKSL
jgi:hypothetical protein